MTVDLAIVGGYGDVGRQAARHWLALHKDASPTLRIGGRDAAAAAGMVAWLRDLYPALAHGISSVAVDVFDKASLHDFVDDADVVLNCAGPSYRIGDRVARAALRAHVDYVDAAGDENLAAMIRSGAPVGRRMVLSAGMRPGLSGLLPRWLAADMPNPRRMTSHIGVLDRFTRAAAQDFLHAGNGGDSVPLSAWRGGVRHRLLRRLDDQIVPGFRQRVALLPYLDREAERLARALRLEEGDWYTAVEGEKVLAVFDRTHALPRDEVAGALRLASTVDLASREPRVTMLVQMDADDESRSILVQADGNATLSGAFAAVTCAAVGQGRMRTGIHHAADVLDPVATMTALQGLGAFGTFVVLDGPATLLWEAEEGAL